MSVLYRRGRIWWVAGRDRYGTRWYASTKQTDRQAATAVRRQLELEFAVPEAGKAARLTLLQAIELRAAALVRANRAKATREIQELKGRHLVEAFGADRRVASLTLADTTAYVDQRIRDGASLHTAQKEIRALCESLGTAKRLGLYLGEPRELRPPELRGAYKPKERYLPGSDWPLLLAAMKPRKGEKDRRPYVIMYLHTGIRKGELYRIIRESVDLAAGTLRIEGTKTEAARRTIPMSATVRAILEPLARKAAPGKPLFQYWLPSPADRALKAACRRAKLPECSFNDLRRSFCSHLANAGVPEGTVIDLMGHTSADMVRRVYARLSPATRQEAIDRLPELIVTASVTPLGTKTTLQGSSEPSPRRSAERKTRRI